MLPDLAALVQVAHDLDERALHEQAADETEPDRDEPRQLCVRAGRERIRERDDREDQPRHDDRPPG